MSSGEGAAAVRGPADIPRTAAPRPGESRRHWRAVVCPRCDAHVDEPCWSGPFGSARLAPHRERQARAALYQACEVEQ